MSKRQRKKTRGGTGMITTDIEDLNEIGDYVTILGLPYAPRKIVDIDVTMFPPVYTLHMDDIDIKNGFDLYEGYSHEDVEYMTFDAVEHWQGLQAREEVAR